MFRSAREIVEQCYNRGNFNAPNNPDEWSDYIEVVRGRKIVAANGEESVQYGTLKYFLLCALGGIPSCGVTHGLVVPLDLVKTRLQVNPGKYKNLFHGIKLTVKEEGLTKGLTKGWAPTVIGYSFQGACKFGFYEFFKVYYAKLIGEDNFYKWRTAVYLAASASAEFIADIALSPWEATRVKMQTSKNFPTRLIPAMTKMYKEEGINAFYRTLTPLWGRQIPYTMMKFACFERTLELLYAYVVPKPREECTKAEQLLVTFAAGYIAGVFCAIVSHPADTLVSKLNQEKGVTAAELYKKIGFANLWKGLETRIIMIGTLTALQWFIYDFVKVMLKIPRPPPPKEKN